MRSQGGGYLLLCDYENAFMALLGDLPVTNRPALSPARAAKLLPVVQAALMAVPDATKLSSYQVECRWPPKHPHSRCAHDVPCACHMHRSRMVTDGNRGHSPHTDHRDHCGRVLRRRLIEIFCLHRIAGVARLLQHFHEAPALVEGGLRCLCKRLCVDCAGPGDAAVSRSENGAKDGTARRLWPRDRRRRQCRRRAS